MKNRQCPKKRKVAGEHMCLDFQTLYKWLPRRSLPAVCTSMVIYIRPKVHLTGHENVAY